MTANQLPSVSAIALTRTAATWTSSSPCLLPLHFSHSPLWVEVEYVNRIPACRMRRLKACPDGSASISVGLRQHPVYPLPECQPKTLPIFSNLSCQIPLNHFYTWYNMLLTGLHHSPVVSIPLLLPTNSSIFPLHLPLSFSSLCARELVAIIIIMTIDCY